MENKTNTGAIFKNDKKTSDKQPDYKGKVNVNGKEMEVALWVKQGKNGSFFSAAFSGSGTFTFDKTTGLGIVGIREVLPAPAAPYTRSFTPDAASGVWLP